ncbi:ABC transporter substrate-binding protein [Spongisporangium articulatum]|uniref:ABC transporter substrate-binding protein n=1 Tax=Spongisporangium articulatum TaxID=3362603 RepID=A0ABW8AGV9_9ACTN
MLVTAACAPPSDGGGDSGTDTSATATSVADFGGLDGLVAAAKKEGQLNVIALPPDWANYGNIIKAFTAKYGIKINSATPDGSSQDEINAVKQQGKTNRAPDVLDMGGAVTVANQSLYAPYKVQTWADIPDSQKEATGLWVNDYGGYMSIGYDSAKLPAVTSITDLEKPAFKGKVALNGDPTQANAALNGVEMASLATGGSLDDISKGVEWFKKLNGLKNFSKTQATSATVKSGSTPVVFDWDYLQVGHQADVKAWKVFIPENAVLGGYYNQAINKNAPHPAAARLWEEFLFSDEGQNLWLAGGAHPVRQEAMTTAGTIDKDAVAKLPKVEGTPVFQTQAQVTKASEYLAANWAKAIG